MSGRLRSWGLIGVGLIAGVSISYGVTAYAFRDNRFPIPVEEIREFTDVFGAIKANYVEPVEDKKLMQEAISGMLAGLDPHSAFLDGDAYRDLQIGTQGEFGGLGIEVGSEDGAIKVIAPIDDTPAARAGIRAGDIIIKIDDKFTRGMTLADAIKLMRGKPQTPITLTLARKGEAQPLEVKIIRDIIRVQSVKSHVIEPGYGFVRITQFQDRTTEDLVKQIGQLYKSGPLKGLVMDLRNDPGGVLNGAVGVAAVFLPRDAVVVSTEGRTEDAHRRFVAAPSDYLRGGGDDPLTHLPAEVKTVPLIVLVNGASASASEIVAGALQDHKRAVVLGTKTFGKGSVQTVIPLSDGSGLRLTTAKYFTPKGRSIHGTGLEPDIVVELPRPAAQAAVHQLSEADLQKQRPTAPPQERKIGDEEGDAGAPIARPEVGDAKSDIQLQRALEILKATRILERSVEPTKSPS